MKQPLVTLKIQLSEQDLAELEQRAADEKVKPATLVRRAIQSGNLWWSLQRGRKP